MDHYRDAPPPRWPSRAEVGDRLRSRLFQLFNALARRMHKHIGALRQPRDVSVLHL